MSGTIKFNGMAELTAGLRQRIDDSLAKQVVQLNGAEMQNTAMRLCPVDTGQLKRSIMLAVSNGGLTVTVAPHTNYAAYVEYGTRKMDAQPYIRPAYYQQKEIFRRDLEKLVR